MEADVLEGGISGHPQISSLHAMTTANCSSNQPRSRARLVALRPCRKEARSCGLKKACSGIMT